MDRSIRIDCGKKRFSRITLNIFRAYTSGDMYDCTFKVGNDQTGYQDFKAHKLILAQASPVFKVMLFGPFKEAALGRDEPILMKDVDPKTFNRTLSLIYGGEVNFEDFSAAIDVATFSNMMDIRFALKAVISQLIKVTDATNVLEVYNLFQKMNMNEEDERLIKCYTLLSQSPKELESTNSMKMSAISVESLLKSEQTQIPEMALFVFLENWGKENFPRQQTQTLRTFLDPLLKLIRFRAMTELEIQQIIGKSDILTAQEKFQIELSSAKKSPDMLPQGFSLLKKRIKCPTFEVTNPFHHRQPHHAPFWDLNNCFSSITFLADTKLHFIGFSIHLPSTPDGFTFTVSLTRNDRDNSIFLFPSQFQSKPIKGDQANFFSYTKEIVPDKKYTLKIKNLKKSFNGSGEFSKIQSLSVVENKCGSITFFEEHQVATARIAKLHFQLHKGCEDAFTCPD